jgi:hypothetical protein
MTRQTEDGNNKKAQSAFLRRLIAARNIKCSTKERKLLLLYYACNAGKDGSFFKDYRRIRHDTGLAYSTIKRTNESFIETGILQEVKGRNWYGGDANSYVLILGVMEKLAKQHSDAYDPKADDEVEKNRERQRRWYAKHGRKGRQTLGPGVRITDEGLVIGDPDLTLSPNGPNAQTLTGEALGSGAHGLKGNGPVNGHRDDCSLASPISDTNVGNRGNGHQSVVTTAKDAGALGSSVRNYPDDELTQQLIDELRRDY